MSETSKIPEVVYKYRDWGDDYHKLILTHNIAYFASARKFNDPFDCAVPPRYDLGTDEQIVSLYKNYLQQGNPGWDQARVEAEAEEWFNKGLFRDDDHMQWWFSRLQDFKYNEFGLFTVSGVRDNLLMWSHYSDSHKGFCVGLDGESLEEYLKSLARNDELCVDTLRVKYCAEYPVLNPFELDDVQWGSQQFVVKSSDWRYEHEWRYVLIGKTDVSLGFPKEAIVEVIL